MEATQFAPATQPAQSPPPQIGYPTLNQLLTGAWRDFLAIKSKILPLAIVFIVIEIGLKLLKSSVGNSALQYTPWYSLILGLDFYLPFFLNLFFMLTLLIATRQNTNLSAVVNLGLKKLPAAIFLVLVVLFVTTGGAVLFFLPGIYYTVTLSLVVVALVESDSNSIFEAIKTSRQLARGNFWSILFSYFGLGVVFVPIVLVMVVVIALLSMTNIASAQTTSEYGFNALEYLLGLPLMALFTKQIFVSLVNIKLSNNTFAERPARFFKLIPFIFLGFIIQSVVFLFANLNIIHLDLPPQDLGELEIELIDASNPSTNAYLYLEAASKAFRSDANFEQVYTQLLEGQRYDQNQINSILESNRQSLQFFDTTLSQPFYQSPLRQPTPFSQKDVKPSDEPLSTTDAIAIAKLNSIRAYDYMNRGEQKLALETAEKNIVLGQKMIDSPNPQMLTLLLGLSFKQQGVRVIQSLIPTIVEVEVITPQLVSGYNRYRFKTDPFVRYLKTDATITVEYFDKMHSSEFFKRENKINGYQPERTKRHYMDHIRQLMRFVEAEDFQGLKEFEEQFEFNLDPLQLMNLVVQGNYAGRILTQTQFSLIELHKQVEKFQEFDKEIDKLQTALNSRVRAVEEDRARQSQAAEN